MEEIIYVGGSGVWNLARDQSIGGVIPKKGPYAPLRSEKNMQLIREGIKQETKAPHKLNGGAIWKIKVD